jgi:Ni/Fe-hydrogenase subunit HybB-like protein
MRGFSAIAPKIQFAESRTSFEFTPRIEDSMLIYFSLLVALIGVLMYVLVVNPKLQEIGRLMFFSGLLAFLLQVSSAHFGIVAR